MGSLVIAVLVLTGASLLNPRDDSVASLVIEAPNIRPGIAAHLPLDVPLASKLLLSEGVGGQDDPYLFCLASTVSGRLSCLFTVSLVGEPLHLEPLQWYQVTASFGEIEADARLAGRLLTATHTAFRPLTGPEQERESRFSERSESLSNWAVANNITGYLRTDGIYVLYLDDEAS